HRCPCARPTPDRRKGPARRAARSATRRRASRPDFPDSTWFDLPLREGRGYAEKSAAARNSTWRRAYGAASGGGEDPDRGRCTQRRLLAAECITARRRKTAPARLDREAAFRERRATRASRPAARAWAGRWPVGRRPERPGCRPRPAPETVAGPGGRGRGGARPRPRTA